MKILLDTQVWLWMVNSPQRLGRHAKRQIESERNERILSAASAWEIAIKCAIGKLTLPERPSEFYPDLKVLQGGDAIVGVAPNIDFPFKGSGVEWIRVLNQVAKLDFDTVVPGHSAQGQTTMTRADFMAYKMKWETLISRARELVKKGTPKDQLLAQIKTDDIGWNVNTQQWQQPARLDPFYDELKASLRNGS